MHTLVDVGLVLALIVFCAFVFGDVPSSWFGDSSLGAKLLGGFVGAVVGCLAGYVIASAGAMF